MMGQFEQLDQMLTEQEGMLRTSQVVSSGISKPVFYCVQQKQHGIGNRSGNQIHFGFDAFTKFFQISVPPQITSFF